MNLLSKLDKKYTTEFEDVLRKPLEKEGFYISSMFHLTNNVLKLTLSDTLDDDPKKRIEIIKKIIKSSIPSVSRVILTKSRVGLHSDKEKKGLYNYKYTFNIHKGIL